MILLRTGIVLGSCTLVRIAELLLANLLFRLRVLLALSVLLRSSLLYLLHLRNLGTGKDRADAVVHLVNHLIPYLCTLQFEDEQRVFLLV